MLQIDGNIIDAASMAIYAALHCTKIPKIELVVGESGGFEDFDVSSDLAEAKNIIVNDVPLCVTAAKVLFWIWFFKLQSILFR